jgi:large subunit ribosomal protein L30
MKYRVTLVRSPAGRLPQQRATVKALGLRKLYHSVEIEPTPAMIGMVKAISHLVVVEEVKS